MEQSGTHENASGERFEEDEQKLPSTLGERMAKVFDDMRREGMSTEAIYTQLYSDLRRLAHKKVGFAPGIGATSMVHTIWLRLYGKEPDHWTSGEHFVNFMAHAMQNLLIDEFRKPHPGPLPVDVGSDPGWKTRMAVSEALEHLEVRDRRQAQIVRLVMVGGLTQEQAAVHLKYSLSTVKKEYRKAKAWLTDYLENGV